MFKEMIDRVSSERTNELIDYSMSNSFLDKESFKKKLMSINNISETELMSLLKATYSSILLDIISGKDKDYLQAFTTEKFINCLISIYKDNEFSIADKLHCNHIIYNYIVLDNNDSNIVDCMMRLSNLINKENVNNLLGLGLSLKLSNYLALNRNSDKKDIINISRVNFTIVSSNQEIMTPQMIVNIYEKLFDKIGLVFETIMFTVYDHDSEWITDDILEVDSNMYLAIVTILENMEFEAIKKILRSYVSRFSLEYKENEDKIKSSLHELNFIDFKRTLKAIEELQLEGIYVP